jgi:hypothetical protein
VKQARRRHRRRALASIVAIVAAGAGAGLAFTTVHAPSPVRPGATLAPAAVLAQAPDVGMACLGPGACDRVGVAIWLRRPARSVSASVAGHAVSLDVAAAMPFQPSVAAKREMFVGYFRWADLVGVRIFFAAGPPSSWSARTPAAWPTPRIAIRIDYGRRGVAVTELRVPLQEGWG